MSKKQSFHDLKEMLELREGEIDELNLEIAEKDEKIAKLTRYIAKLKNDNKSLEIKMESEIKRIEGKLANEGFVAKAPAEVIEKEKEKMAKYQASKEALLVRLNDYRA